MVIDDEVDFLDTLRRGLVTSGFTNVKTGNSLAKLSVSQNYLKNCWRSQNRYAI